MYKMYTPSYISLEPYIDTYSLNLHYNGLYKKYTDKLNTLLKETNYNYKYTAVELAKDIGIMPLNYRDEILYNLGGYLNHSLYFYNLTDKQKEIPIEFLKLIEKNFKSFNNFKNIFIKTAMSLAGSGYTFLVLDSNSTLRIINMSNQDTPYYYGFIPLMTIDLWEHSYYIKYNYKRIDYLNNIFNIIDFNKVYNLYLYNKKAL